MKISDIHSNGGSQNLMNSQSRRTAHNIGGKAESGKQKAETPHPLWCLLTPDDCGRESRHAETRRQH
jgi:hypothetical protein